MRRVLARGLLLGVLVLLLLVLSDYAVRRVTPPSIFEQKLRAIDRADLSQVQVVTLGTSRPYQGVDPHQLPWPAYSLCDIHQLLWFSNQMLIHNLPRMPHLRTVIFGIDEFMFGEAPDGPMVPDYIRHGYAPAIDNWQDRAAAASPLFRYRRDLLPALLASALQHDYYGHPTRIDDGFEPSHPLESTLLTGSGFFWWPPRPAILTPDTAASRVRDYTSGYEPIYRPTNRACLTALLRTAVSHHVHVLLLQTPQTTWYRNAADASMLRDFSQDLATVTSQFTPATVRLQSYRETTFPDAEFADVDHLNASGARHLTTLVATDAAAFINAEVARSR